jgi:imidazolonepropionase-like amidohydrolase
MLLISNGRVLDPASGTDAPRDILLDGDRIAAVAPHGQLAARAKGAEIFDAKNLIVAPGFIDLHCHLREPGGESSETIETGMRAAARGAEYAARERQCFPDALDHGARRRGCKRARVADWRGVDREQRRSTCGNRRHETSGNRRRLR